MTSKIISISFACKKAKKKSHCVKARKFLTGPSSKENLPKFYKELLYSLVSALNEPIPMLRTFNVT